MAQVWSFGTEREVTGGTTETGPCRGSSTVSSRGSSCVAGVGDGSLQGSKECNTHGEVKSFSENTDRGDSVTRKTGWRCQGVEKKILTGYDFPRLRR